MTQPKSTAKRLAGIRTALRLLKKSGKKIDTRLKRLETLLKEEAQEQKKRRPR